MQGNEASSVAVDKIPGPVSQEVAYETAAEEGQHLFTRGMTRVLRHGRILFMRYCRETGCSGTVIIWTICLHLLKSLCTWEAT